MLLTVIRFEDRDLLVEQLYNYIISSSITNNFMLYGAPGSGKKHVLHKLSLNLSKCNDVSILKFVDDQLVEDGKKYSTKESNFSLSLSIYAGISWDMRDKNNSRITYLINLFKTISSSKIVILKTHFDSAKSEIKNILSIIVENKDFLESQTGKKIFVIITSNYQEDHLHYPVFDS